MYVALEEGVALLVKKFFSVHTSCSVLGAVDRFGVLFDTLGILGTGYFGSEVDDRGG